MTAPDMKEKECTDLAPSFGCGVSLLKTTLVCSEYVDMPELVLGSKEGHSLVSSQLYLVGENKLFVSLNTHLLNMC